MSSLHRGFTLVELMIVIAIIAILASIIVPALSGPGGLRGSEEKARTAARGYYRQLYPELIELRVVCTQSDSDGDGYISCSGRGATETKEWRDLQPIECSGGGSAA